MGIWKIRAAVATALLSACLGVLPESRGPVELVEVSRFTSHFHEGTRTQEHHLEPADEGRRAPVRCEAYRTNESFSRDACVVHEGAEREQGTADPTPWTLRVTYRVRQTENQDFAVGARAFDAHGNLGAIWSGRQAPEMRWVTE